MRSRPADKAIQQQSKNSSPSLECSEIFIELTCFTNRHNFLIQNQLKSTVALTRGRSGVECSAVERRGSFKQRQKNAYSKYPTPNLVVESWVSYSYLVVTEW